MTTTRSFARLGISQAAYDEIKGRLEKTMYRDQIGRTAIYLTGLALEPLPEPVKEETDEV